MLFKYISVINNEIFLNTMLPDTFNFKNFLFLRKATFLTFFINNLIDTPICFKKSKSLFRNKLTFNFIKLINYVLKHGKKEQYVKLFLNAVNLLYLKFQKNQKNQQTFNVNLTWLNLYLILNFKFLSFKDTFSIEFNNNKLIQLHVQNKHNNVLFQNNEKFFNNNSFFKTFILNKILLYEPIFNFFIYNVDKKIKKYSRGKTGKYLFVWKYIPKYKRNFVILKFIKKDIKFNQGKDLITKIFNSLDKLIHDFTKTFIWKTKLFTYNYIFKNFKKTLMTTLRTIR